MCHLCFAVSLPERKRANNDDQPLADAGRWPEARVCTLLSVLSVELELNCIFLQSMGDEALL